MITEKEIESIVAAFFRQWMMRIVCEGKDAKSVTLNDMEPRQVKLAVAQHIEEVSVEFNREMFYAMMTRNYTEQEAEPMLRTFVAEYVKGHGGQQPGFMELLPFACRTDAVYSALIDAYREHFMLMLDGKA